ncbi:MAG: hypothetical protein K9H64_12065 [Bacteroidales bacterium]|nr:hypothetical protein [Bacteroidales bacterium]MCF8456819.1 hypothetical protein [Bacteroidales bacterium]
MSKKANYPDNNCKYWHFPQNEAYLFKEFSRIKNSKTKNITGSGLGLSIMKKMVELNNGQITLESVVDKGSVFTVTIPAA